MTTTSQIITDAFRQSNLLSINATVTTAQQTEALRYLNRIVKSVFGNEVGDPLEAFPIGRNNINRPSGYPWWNTTPGNDWFVPKNVRLMMNVTQSLSLYLHPDPDDGSRFAVNDASNNLATYPATVYGNGRLIESATSVVLNVSGSETEWFYRADLSNWQKYSPLIAADIFPFPEEFDDYFISMLALRLNPAYGSAMDPQSEAIMTRSLRQIRARYTQCIPVRSELGLIRPSKMAADRDRWGNEYEYYDPSSMFDRGWPY